MCRKDVEEFYLYVYDETGFNKFDHLQHTLYWAQQQAEEEYGVPLDARAEASE